FSARQVRTGSSFAGSGDQKLAGLDVLVVVEHVLGVVFRFDVGEPPVRVVAVGLADAAGVVVGVEEVHVDAGGVGLEGGEELPGPRRLGGAGGVVLLGEPYRVDDDVVLDVAAGVGGGVARGPGDRAAQVEHRRVRPR